MAIGHVRGQELRDFANKWLDDENDYRLPNESFTGDEVAYMSLVIIKSEGDVDIVEDFLNQIIDTQSY